MYDYHHPHFHIPQSNIYNHIREGTCYLISLTFPFHVNMEYYGIVMFTHLVSFLIFPQFPIYIYTHICYHMYIRAYSFIFPYIMYIYIYIPIYRYSDIPIDITCSHEFHPHQTRVARWTRPTNRPGCEEA